jgi:hypothetical protein
VTNAATDASGLVLLVHRISEFDQTAVAAIKSMTSARFLHDQRELCGGKLALADAVKLMGLPAGSRKLRRV